MEHFLHCCISYTSLKKAELLDGKILSLPWLSGQMASTMMSVGNEQKRSKGKFVLQRKDCCDNSLFISFFAPELTASDWSQVVSYLALS